MRGIQPALRASRGQTISAADLAIGLLAGHPKLLRQARHADKVSDAAGWVMAWYGGGGRRGTSRSGVGRKAENLMKVYAFDVDETLYLS